MSYTIPGVKYRNVLLNPVASVGMLPLIIFMSDIERRTVSCFEFVFALDAMLVIMGTSTLALLFHDDWSTRPAI